MIYYNNKVFKKIIDNKDIKAKILKISDALNKYYNDDKFIILSILHGSIMVVSDLVKNLKVSYVVDYIELSSYKGTTESSGHIKIINDINLNVKNKKILIVEDIVDSGRTLNFLYKKLLNMGAEDVKVFSLLFKKDRYKFDINVDWYGFEIENLFTIGYGMDYNFKFRGLNDIYALS